MYDSARMRIYNRLLDDQKYEELLELIELDYKDARGGMSWWDRLQTRRQILVVRLGVWVLLGIRAQKQS